MEGATYRPSETMGEKVRTVPTDKVHVKYTTEGVSEQSSGH